MHEMPSVIPDFSRNEIEILPIAVEERVPSVIAHELAMLTRERDLGSYMQKLIAIDRELVPADNLPWPIEDRTRTRLSESLLMDEQALCRRLRVLKTGYEQAYPEEKENNSLAFVRYIPPQEETPRYHHALHVLPYDQSLRLIILDLLSRGYRSEVLAKKAQTMWTNNIEQFIEAIYGYKSIKESYALLESGENIVYRAIKAVIPGWKTSLPLNLSEHVGGVYLSQAHIRLIREYISNRKLERAMQEKKLSDVPKKIKAPRPPRPPRPPKPPKAEKSAKPREKKPQATLAKLPIMQPVPAREIAQSVHDTFIPVLTNDMIPKITKVLRKIGDGIPDELEMKELQKEIEKMMKTPITISAIYAIIAMIKIRKKRRTENATE
jgi:hypothetical protein